MYKALVNIGEYAEGDIVPDEKAETWAKMYRVSPVEKVNSVPEIIKGSVPEEKVEQPIEKKVEVKSGQEPSEVSSADLSEDYLGRNTKVVVKNIQTDKLNKVQLDKLLKLETSGKKRPEVIKALGRKMGEFK